MLKVRDLSTESRSSIIESVDSINRVSEVFH